MGDHSRARRGGCSYKYCKLTEAEKRRAFIISVYSKKNIEKKHKEKYAVTPFRDVMKYLGYEVFANHNSSQQQLTTTAYNRSSQQQPTATAFNSSSLLKLTTTSNHSLK